MVLKARMSNNTMRGKQMQNKVRIDYVVDESKKYLGNESPKKRFASMRAVFKQRTNENEEKRLNGTIKNKVKQSANRMNINLQFTYSSDAYPSHPSLFSFRPLLRSFQSASPSP